MQMSNRDAMQMSIDHIRQIGNAMPCSKAEKIARMLQEGLSAKEISNLLNCHVGYVSAIKHGRRSQKAYEARKKELLGVHRSTHKYRSDPEFRDRRKERQRKYKRKGKHEI